MRDDATAYAVSVFLEEAARLRSLSAASVIDQLRFYLRAGERGRIQEVTVDAPDDEATIAFFAKVRAFGTPKKVVYVGRFIDLIEVEATNPEAEVIAHLRESLADLGVVSHQWHKLVLGPDASPRDVFELFTYARVIHTDEDKRQRWDAFGEVEQAMAKYVAYSYAGHLYHLVTVVEAMLRDPRGAARLIVMQYLAPRPGLPIPEELAGFKAARIRLRDPAEDSP